MENAPEPSQAAATGDRSQPWFSSRILVRPPGSEAVRIEYPAAPLFVVVSAWWLVTLPLYVVLPLDLLRLGWLGPIVSLLVACALNGLPGYLFVYYWPRRLLIGSQEVTLYSGLPFFGARRRLPTVEAEKVYIDRRYVVVLRKGETTSSATSSSPRLASHAEARWLAAEIERALAAQR